MGKIVQLFFIAALIAVLQCFPVEETSEATSEATAHVHHDGDHDHKHDHDHDHDHEHHDHSKEVTEKSRRSVRDVSQNHPSVGSASHPSVGSSGSSYGGSSGSPYGGSSGSPYGSAGSPSVGRAAPSVGHSQSHPSVLSQASSASGSSNHQQYHRQVREAETTTTVSSTTEESDEKDSKEEPDHPPAVLTATSFSRQSRDTQHAEGSSTTVPSVLGQGEVKYSHNRPSNIGQERHVREVSSTTESDEETSTSSSEKTRPSLLAHQRQERDTKQQPAPASHVNKDAKAKPLVQPILLNQKRH